MCSYGERIYILSRNNLLLTPWEVGNGYPSKVIIYSDSNTFLLLLLLRAFSKKKRIDSSFFFQSLKMVPPAILDCRQNRVCKNTFRERMMMTFRFTPWFWFGGSNRETGNGQKFVIYLHSLYSSHSQPAGEGPHHLPRNRGLLLWRFRRRSLHFRLCFRSPQRSRMPGEKLKFKLNRKHLHELIFDFLQIQKLKSNFWTSVSRKSTDRWLPKGRGKYSSVENTARERLYC